MALVRRVVILGAGSAGWMTAAALARIDHFKRFGRLIPGQVERNDPLIDYRVANGTDDLEKLRLAMAHAAKGLPTHRAYIERHGPALCSL